MKTIFDKVDPKYIECGAGVCEHPLHQATSVIIITLLLTITFVSLYKLKHLKT